MSSFHWNLPAVPAFPQSLKLFLWDLDAEVTGTYEIQQLDDMHKVKMGVWALWDAGVSLAEWQIRKRLCGPPRHLPATSSPGVKLSGGKCWQVPLRVWNFSCWYIRHSTGKISTLGDFLWVSCSSEPLKREHCRSAWTSLRGAASHFFSSQKDFVNPWRKL